jgi:hypothetical protein
LALKKKSYRHYHMASGLIKWIRHRQGGLHSVAESHFFSSYRRLTRTNTIGLYLSRAHAEKAKYFAPVVELLARDDGRVLPSWDDYPHVFDFGSGPSAVSGALRIVLGVPQSQNASPAPAALDVAAFLRKMHPSCQ